MTDLPPARTRSGEIAPTTTSIAGRLLRTIFSAYFLFTLVVTAVQLVAEYRNTERRVSAELASMQRTFGPGMADAMWRFQDDVLHGILAGMNELPIVVGVKIQDEKGSLMSAVGTIMDDAGRRMKADFQGLLSPAPAANGLLAHTFGREFPIVFVDERGKQRHIGVATVYSDRRVILEQLEYGFLLIFVSAIIKATALWFIFFYVVQRWLGKPLNQLGDYVRRLTIDNLGEQPFVLAGRSRHELHYLADVLNEMVRNLRGSVDKNAALYRALELEQAALRELNKHLEQRVAERTADLQDANRKLAELSITDGLTGLTNRRHFDTSFADEYGRAQRGGHALALIMLDVDYFKPFNDQYGHQAGDDCLQMLARTLMENARRPSDLVARYGGEEFIVLAAETDLSHARHLAESICRAVAAMNIAHVQSPWGTVTVSVGMAIRVVDGSWKPQDLLRMADQALYRAKERGRNRVECLADGDLR